MSKGALGLLSAYWPEGTPRYTHAPLKRVTDLCVFEPADREPDRPALRVEERSLSYAELAQRVRAVEAALRARAERGMRVAVVAEDPLQLVPCALGALAADLLVWAEARRPEARALRAFAPEWAVSPTPLEPPGADRTLTPEQVFAETGEEEDAPRAKLREPILALPRPGGGEVLHSHRSLVTTAIAFREFYLLEPGAEMLVRDPPTGWLGLATGLGALAAGATVHAAWDGAESEGLSVDYWVASLATAERERLTPGTRPRAGGIRAGAVIGVDAGITAARRRRLSRRLRTPVLTLYGRNDLGPVLGSHPTWFLDDAVGIPLPNVDLRPLDPADGRELAIGWDAVEEAEMGVKSALAPAGGELAGSWLRSHEIVHVDPTGLYFLRRRA